MVWKIIKIDRHLSFPNLNVTTKVANLHQSPYNTAYLNSKHGAIVVFMIQEIGPKEGEGTPPEEPQKEIESEEAKKVTSMEDLLAQEDLSLNLPRQGETRTGVIVGVNEDEYLVSIGAKSEGIIPSREISQIDPEDREKFDIGVEIPVFVITTEDSSGNLLLSYVRAIEEADWDNVEKLETSGEVFEGTISGYNKGGLIVDFGRLRGFVPASQVSLSRRMAYGGSSPDQRWGNMVGDSIIARVIEVDRSRHRLIFSELAALQESREIFKERLLSKIQKGDVLTGRVTSLADFGAFVNIDGADGLVHITEISWDHIDHPSQVLTVGQEVQVKVINIDEENKRIGLSIRQLIEDPWPEKVAQFREGQLVVGTIVRLVKFGAFARLENTDLEGLIHISELSENRIEHPKEVLKEDEVLTLRIIRIDVPQRRIGLSLRKVHSLAYADLDLKMAMDEEAETKAEIESEPEEVDLDLDTAMDEETETKAEVESEPEEADQDLKMVVDEAAEAETEDESEPGELVVVEAEEVLEVEEEEQSVTEVEDETEEHITDESLEDVVLDEEQNVPAPAEE
jgi:small subunit ribosomal protein S1